MGKKLILHLLTNKFSVKEAAVATETATKFVELFQKIGMDGEMLNEFSKDHRNRILNNYANSHQILIQLQKNLESKVETLKKEMISLYTTLNKKMPEFQFKHTSLKDQIVIIEKEIERCNLEIKDRDDAIKKSEIKIAVAECRNELKVLWAKAFYSEEKQKEFPCFDSDVYNEDLLAAHNLEIQKIKSYIAENKNVFELVEQRNDLWKKFHELQKLATDPVRLKNRGGLLLKHQKEHNDVLKQIPSVGTRYQPLVSAQTTTLT